VNWKGNLDDSDFQLYFKKADYVKTKHTEQSDYS